MGLLPHPPMPRNAVFLRRCGGRAGRDNYDWVSGFLLRFRDQGLGFRDWVLFGCIRCFRSTTNPSAQAITEHMMFVLVLGLRVLQTSDRVPVAITSTNPWFHPCDYGCHQCSLLFLDNERGNFKLFGLIY